MVLLSLREIDEASCYLKELSHDDFRVFGQNYLKLKLNTFVAREMLIRERLKANFETELKLLLLHTAGWYKNVFAESGEEG